METFQILGAVRAHGSDGELDLGPPQQRCLLALLLLQAGRPAHVERLIDLLWGEDPPPGARTTVQVYVSKLRKLLSGRPGVDLVTASGPRYELNVDPEQVDIHRFRRLVAKAGSAETDESASTLLRQALELWSGPALDDVAPAHLRTSLCAGLAEERLAAWEQRIDADLRLGRYALLVPELTELVRQHPLRERLTAQLMTALYAGGRRADALSQYQQLRHRLGEELGVDPTPQLDELHQSLLRDDLEIAGFPTNGSTAGRTRLPVPAQLPADLQTFTGRTNELHRLLELMPNEGHEAPPIVIAAIDGMAGIGKTTLAVHAAHQMAPLFPDGQIFIDLHGFTEGVAPVEPAEALDRILRSLGIPGDQISSGVDDRAALYRSTLAGRRMLVLLDDAATESQVRPLLPATPGSIALITSRRRLNGLDDVRSLSLDVFPPEDAITLFARAAGEERVADQPPGLVSDVTELCGRLPLAVRIAAARMSARPAWTLAHLVDRLRDQQHRLTELEVGERSVRAAVDLSFDQLTADQQRVFALMGLHPGPDIDTFAIAALEGSSPADAGRMLDGLLDAHLLQQHRQGRYQFHDLVRAFAAHICEEQVPEHQRNAAVARLLDHFAHAASVAMDAVYPHEANRRPRIPAPGTPIPALQEQRCAMTWLDTELDNLLAVATYAADHGWTAHVRNLAATLHRHLHAGGRYTEALTLHNRALRHARGSGDGAGELRALLDLAKVHRMQERTGAAKECFEKALILARNSKDPAGQIDALIGLGYIRSMSGWYAESADSLEAALALARDTEDHACELAALIGLGFAHCQRRHYREASEYYELALELARRVGSRIDEVSAQLGLGLVNRGQGRYSPAADFFEKALRLSRSSGRPDPGPPPEESGLGLYRQGEFNALIGLGDVHRELGRYEKAVNCFRQVLRLAHAIGNRNYQFEAHEGLGSVHFTTGNLQEAVTDYESALGLARDLDQHSDEVRAHQGLARAYHALGSRDLAREHWEEALEILTRLGIAEIEVVSTDEVRANLAALDDQHGVGNAGALR
jgi:DNA-binding SARP family transcriptional activator/Tfp pilus assembly protein PilF